MAEAPQPIAEIDHGPSQFEQFLDNHQKKLIIGAILIALGVVASVIWSGLEEGKQQEAGAALVKADEAADYRDVIKNHPDSNAAASAMPLLADLQWQDSQPDAIKTLEDFIAAHPEHPAILTAKVSLGLRLLDQGKHEEARNTLAEVAESHPDSYLGPLAAVALGDLAKAQGKTDVAKDWYEKARDGDTQRSMFQNLATDRLAIVNAKPPVKVQPAPPKPPVPPTDETPAPQPGTETTPDALPTPALPAGDKNTAPPTPMEPSGDTSPQGDKKKDDTQLPAPKLSVPDTPAEDQPDKDKKEKSTQPGTPQSEKAEPTSGQITASGSF